MIDGKCWMIDNLKYIDTTIINIDETTGMVYNNGDHKNNGGTTAYNTAGENTTSSAANYDKAFYNNPAMRSGCYNMSASTLTYCGYLYNWYAATNGTGTYSMNTDGVQAIGSICPTGFRLPSSLSGLDGPTTNGISFGLADFPLLNASMQTGSLTIGEDSDYYANWLSSGVWKGTYSGRYTDSLSYQSTDGYYWSSTANNNSTYAYMLRFFSSYSKVNSLETQSTGYGVRCVKDKPPDTVTPNVISSTNPAVVDVYPTTGWTGDTVTITSNALFTNVQSVTIGGSACSAHNVVSTSLITCTLPSKSSGSTNDIVVTNGGVNVTDNSTYNHMKVTYFNPSDNSVVINGTTYKLYANGFTSANCSALVASNDASSNLSNSIAYVRDTRNKQTYRVKRMIDGKCWMIDNLKYIDTTIVNVDGTTGMVYNNGDHLGVGATGQYNTVDGTYANKPTTNYDKAFYNNPMNSTAYCMGTANIPANTLTRCGYLYSWYAATAGTGTYAMTDGTQATGSICPTGFRLPSGQSGTGGPTANGTSITVADLPVLSASMRSGSITSGDTDSSYYANWLYSGAWQGMHGGNYIKGMDNANTGHYWSSTKSGTAWRSYTLYFYNISIPTVFPGNGVNNLYSGHAVRCVIL
jgi:uncharacterized protein (TIGR02145 family)